MANVGSIIRPVSKFGKGACQQMTLRKDTVTKRRTNRNKKLHLSNTHNKACSEARRRRQRKAAGTCWGCDACGWVGGTWPRDCCSKRVLSKRWLLRSTEYNPLRFLRSCHWMACWFFWFNSCCCSCCCLANAGLSLQSFSLSPLPLGLGGRTLSLSLSLSLALSRSLSLSLALSRSLCSIYISLSLSLSVF